MMTKRTQRGKKTMSGTSSTFQNDPTFWMLICARRKQPTLSLDQLKKRLRIKR